MSEINLTDHKSISARLFPDEDFREAVHQSVESERDKRWLILESLWIEQTP